MKPPESPAGDPRRAYLHTRASVALSDHYCIDWSNTPRVPDATVEGSRLEMLALAFAVLAQGSATYRRCAVRTSIRTDYVLFWSPRNSRAAQSVPRSCAVRWAHDTITALLGSPGVPYGLVLCAVCPPTPGTQES